MARLVARFGVSRYEADEYYRIALDFYQKRNLEQAVLNMNSAIELFPKRAEYYATRAFFRLEESLFKEAKPDLEMALKLNPYEVLGNYGMGVIAYQDKQYEQAIEYFMKAWAADKQRPESLYYLGMCYHRQKQNDRAAQWMRQALAIYTQAPDEDKEAKRRQKNAERWLQEFEKLISQKA